MTGHEFKRRMVSQEAHVTVDFPKDEDHPFSVMHFHWEDGVETKGWAVEVLAVMIDDEGELTDPDRYGFMINGEPIKAQVGMVVAHSPVKPSRMFLIQSKIEHGEVTEQDIDQAQLMDLHEKAMENVIDQLRDNDEEEEEEEEMV